MSKKNDLSQIVRDKGKDNMQAKLKQDEIDECNLQLKDFKN